MSSRHLTCLSISQFVFYIGLIGQEKVTTPFFLSLNGFYARSIRLTLSEEHLVQCLISCGVGAVQVGPPGTLPYRQIRAKLWLPHYMIPTVSNTYFTCQPIVYFFHFFYLLSEKLHGRIFFKCEWQMYPFKAVSFCSIFLVPLEGPKLDNSSSSSLEETVDGAFKKPVTL